MRSINELTQSTRKFMHYSSASAHASRPAFPKLWYAHQTDKPILPYKVPDSTYYAFSNRLVIHYY